MTELGPAVLSVTVGTDQLRFIRSLRAEWAWMEVGAPRLTLLAPGASVASLRERVREVTGPWLVSDESMFEAIYRQGMVAATAFVNHARFTPATCEFESPFVPSRVSEQPFATSERVRIEGGTIRMDVTAEHLALLRSANVRFFDEGGMRCEAAIDPKRPYGEMTFFYADMGRILQIVPEGRPAEGAPFDREFSEEQLRYFDDLHQTTQVALQVLLLRGTLNGETFARHSPAGRWEPEPGQV